MPRTKTTDRQTPETPESSLSPGDTVTVTWGAEKYAPIQYHNFDVGPFATTTTIRDGETAEEAIDRAKTFLGTVAREEFDKKSAGFPNRVKAAAAAAQRAKA